MKRFLLLLFLAVANCSSAMAKPQQNTEEARQFPRNIIMVIADGMGPAYTTAYRNFSDDPNTDMVEPVIFDDIFVGNASTYPASESGYVTDSAAAATALATGIKTYNGAIGVDVNKQPVESVLQRAKTLGLRTGLAVTSQINHATPAAYIAHNESRQNYPQIADRFFDSRVDNQLIADVMLGGGTRYFNREDRDVTAEFINAGYEFAEQYDDLLKIDEGSNVLGLFAEVGLPPALDDPKDDRLAFLTKHAIRFLENPNGFFLLVEASQVDWAGHSCSGLIFYSACPDFICAFETAIIDSIVSTLLTFTDNETKWIDNGTDSIRFGPH